MLLLRSSAEGRAPVLVGWLLGLVCFAYLMALPPTLNSADESFILYEAKRVWQGQAPYRDFFDFLTPGSYYLYALAYAIGGVSITSARAATSLLHAISVVSTYFLTLQVASMAEAIIASVLVVVICVPVWNMASHHWIATSFALASASVLLAHGWRASRRARPAAAGALAGLVVCTHQNRGVWLILWLVIAIPLLTLGRTGLRRWRECAREVAWTAAGGAVVCFTVLGYAVWRSSLAEFLYATHTWVTTNYRNYNVGIMRWAGYGSLWAGGIRYTYLWLFQVTPTLLAIEGVALLWSIWRYRLASQVMRAAVFLLALSAAGAIMYFPDAVHVAFAMPFVLVVLAGMVYRVRTLFAFSETPVAQRLVALVWCAALAVVLLKARTNYRYAWQDNPIPYQTAFGTLSGRELQRDTLRDLRERLRPDESGPPHLFAYPTDAWLYLTLPADNPTPFCLLRPVYNTPEQINTAIAALDNDPQAIVLLNILFSKPGDPFVDYLKLRWHDIGGVGPGVIMGAPVYRLYAPGPPTEG